MVKLGRLEIKNPYILAPMELYSDSCFRSLCYEYGCGYSFTEMIVTAGFVKKTESFREKVDLNTKGGIQFLSNSPEQLKESIRIIKEREFYYNLENVESIDLNLGCPSKNIIDQNLGSGLLDQYELVGELFKVLRKESHVPVSAKIRLGNKGKSFWKILELAERIGLDFVTIHGRLAKQGYSGEVDMESIKRAKENFNIPIIGNGDIVDKKTSKRYLDFCDGIMIGRQALKEPLIFKTLQDKDIDWWKEKKECIKRYIDKAIELDSKLQSIKVHIQALLKDTGEKDLITRIQKCESRDEITDLLKNHNYMG